MFSSSSLMFNTTSKHLVGFIIWKRDYLVQVFKIVPFGGIFETS